MSAESRNSTGLPAPRWLTRAEKAAFRAIEKLRLDAGRPVSPAEVDALCDYVSARSRLTVLRRLYRRTVADQRENPEDPSSQAALLAASRAIDTASAHARRLGRQIGLGGD